MGLRTRIVIALAAVMVLFIILTELSVSRLVRVAMSRQSSDTSVEVGSDSAAERMEQELLQLRKIVFFYIAVGAFVVIVLGSLAVTRLVVRPLSRATAAVEQVAEGQLDTEVPIEGSGELIRLSVAFNRMTATLREQQSELKDRLKALEKSSRELKEVQDRLIRAAKLASVGTLAAGVAHEIGNPLAGVLGLLEALEEESDAEKSVQYRGLMKKEIERIDRIINDLLIYARPARAGTPENSSTSLEEVVEHVRALLGAQSLFDNVEIDVSFTGGPWLLAMSRDDLTQVLLNLLLNAAQAMDGRGKIVIRPERITNWRPGLGVIARDAARIRVADTGPGIPKEHVSEIFDPFFTQSTGGQGSGLGLAICQSICERAGAEIVLDREHNSGSQFILTLLTPSV